MKRWTNSLIVLCTLLSWMPAVGQSGDRVLGVSSTETQGSENTRRLIYKVTPIYPPELKRFSIGGTVRLDVKISPQGTVRTVAPLGGNPALVEAAVAAVKKWKYTPASSDTETQVTVIFDLRR